MSVLLERPSRGASGVAGRAAGRSSATGATRRARPVNTAPAPSPERTRQRGPARSPRPAGNPARGSAPRARPSPANQRAARPPRAPFVLLILGLLAGGLVSLLLLNTVLAQGSFTLDTLRERHTRLTHQMQALQQEVAYQSSPDALAQKARSLGMVPSEHPVFLDTENGKVYGNPGRDGQTSGTTSKTRQPGDPAGTGGAPG